MATRINSFGTYLDVLQREKSARKRDEAALGTEDKISKILVFGPQSLPRLKAFMQDVSLSEFLEALRKLRQFGFVDLSDKGGEQTASLTDIGLTEAQRL